MRNKSIHPAASLVAATPRRPPLFWYHLLGGVENITSLRLLRERCVYVRVCVVVHHDPPSTSAPSSVTSIKAECAGRTRRCSRSDGSGEESMTPLMWADRAREDRHPLLADRAQEVRSATWI